MSEIKYFHSRNDFYATEQLMHFLVLFEIVKGYQSGEIPSCARASVPGAPPLFIEIFDKIDL